MSNATVLPPADKWADLALRSASALVLMPVAIYCVWQGGIWFQIFLGVLAVLMAHEWVAIVHGGNMRSLALHVLAGLCGVFVTAAQGLDAASAAILVVWLCSVLQWVMNAGTSSIWSLFGVFYIGLPMVAFVLLREDGALGLWAVLWCFIIVWAADISAYFAGRTIGGPKLAPRLSPKKTWAGLVGAMAGAAAASSIFAWALGLNMSALALLACILTLVEQAGDILESALKRRYGVKDSGNFIPGHGGVLDRVDGLIAVVFAAAIIGFGHQAGNAAPGLLHW
jgi:phosphatidate cytidylyltransferase